jgi:ARC6-like, IMS domain
VLTQQEAEQVIQTWLTVKSQALGDRHKIDELSSILTGSLLSQWRDRATTLKNNNEHRSYKHEMQVSSLKTDTQNPNVATVDVSVREITSYYYNKQLDSRRSDDDKFLIRYELVRQQDRWLIQNSKLIAR